MHGQYEPGDAYRRQPEAAAETPDHGAVGDIVKLLQKLHDEHRQRIDQERPMNGAAVHQHFACPELFFAGPFRDIHEKYPPCFHFEYSKEGAFPIFHVFYEGI